LERELVIEIIEVRGLNETEEDLKVEIGDLEN
jgi:hypothetical protein